MAKLSIEKRNKLRQKLINYLQQQDSIDITFSEFKLFGFYDGLRLTETGNNIMKSTFDYYVFPIKTPLTIKQKVLINNNLHSCFYIGKNNIVIYDEQEAFNINMIGDLNLWIDSIST